MPAGHPTDGDTDVLHVGVVKGHVTRLEPQGALVRPVNARVVPGGRKNVFEKLV